MGTGKFPEGQRGETAGPAEVSNAGLPDERVDDGNLLGSFLSVYHQIPGDQRLRDNSYFALAYGGKAKVGHGFRGIWSTLCNKLSRVMLK